MTVYVIIALVCVGAILAILGAHIASLKSDLDYAIECYEAEHKGRLECESRIMRLRRIYRTQGSER